MAVLRCRVSVPTRRYARGVTPEELANLAHLRRTRDLMDEFATAFTDADALFVLDIYAASEKPIEGITAEALVGRIAAAGKRNVAHVSSFLDAAEKAAAAAESGDVIFTLGAGSVSQLGPMILEKMKEREPAHTSG